MFILEGFALQEISRRLVASETEWSAGYISGVFSLNQKGGVGPAQGSVS